MSPDGCSALVLFLFSYETGGCIRPSFARRKGFQTGRAAPVASAFLQIDLSPSRDSLDDVCLAGRPGAHRSRGSCHREFRERRRNEGHGNTKRKTKTPNHPADPVVRGRRSGFLTDSHARPDAARWGKSLAEIRWPSGWEVMKFSSPAMSGRSGQTPVRCENCHWPSSHQGARPHQA